MFSRKDSTGPYVSKYDARPPRAVADWQQAIADYTFETRNLMREQNALLGRIAAALELRGA